MGNQGADYLKQEMDIEIASMKCGLRVKGKAHF